MNIYLFISSVIASIIAIVLAVQNHMLRRQNKQNEAEIKKQRLAYQVLSHEKNNWQDSFWNLYEETEVSTEKLKEITAMSWNEGDYAVFWIREEGWPSGRSFSLFDEYHSIRKAILEKES